MTFNIWTFLFEIVNFVVLAYILHRLLYRPLRAAIDQRRADVERARTEADAARADALVLKKQLESQLADVEHQRQELMQKACAAAAEEHGRMIAESQAEIDRRQQESRSAIERQRDDALRSLSGELRSAAADLVERLLRESAGVTLQGQLALRLIESLAQVSEPQKTELREQWSERDGALLETAAALDPKSTQELTSAVETLVGCKVKLVVELKPALVAGARLRIAGQVWDASLASQLDAIRPQNNGNRTA